MPASPTASATTASRSSRRAPETPILPRRQELQPGSPDAERPLTATVKPEFIDNREARTLAQALRDLCADPSCAHAPLDIATAYFNLGAFQQLGSAQRSRRAWARVRASRLSMNSGFMWR